MDSTRNIFRILFLCAGLLALVPSSQAQSGGIQGVVTDPSSGVVSGATIEIRNPVSGFERSTTTDDSGAFTFNNVPFNPYHLTVTAPGFAPLVRDVEIRSSVPLDLKLSLEVATATATVTVQGEAGDLLETESTFHTDVDRTLFEKLPLESQSSSLSSLVTLSSPGIAADSNGLFHGLGDHAENSFSVDGQPITDQQSKVFSNQIPLDSVQALEVISGAPPAEFGGKTSVVIVATTRSGQGVTTPHGSVNTSYGSFGSPSAAFDLAYGGQNWGNFIAVNGLESGRFLDPPEFAVMHDKGNEENAFDRVDYQLTKADSIHLNFGYTRSWFQNPNSFDQQLHPCIPGFPCTGSQIANPLTGNPLGLTDQVSQIKTYNIAPTWTRLLSSSAVFTLGGFVRHDQYNYYPSGDPFNDLAPDLQAETIRQNRKLTNAGVLSNISYVKGMHNLKAGITYDHTFLTENDSLGIVDPTLLPVVFGCPAGPLCAALAPFDLTNPLTDPTGALFSFRGHADVKELALYVQDTITKGNWSFNLGVRGDLYNGLSKGRQAEPRLGIAYNIKPSNTVLRISYARTLETPFNENLVIASTGCGIPFLAALVPPQGVTCNLGGIQPGWRNEFHAGLQEAFGKHLVVDAEYIWKYTHNGYDFGIVGSTPIAFPIEWHNSKIPGFAIRASVPEFHGFTALVVMSGVAARFFLPQVAGLPIIPVSNSVFRIDHDEAFNQTSHVQYQPWKRGPWFGLNWRYDSGLVSGAIPCSAPTATCFASTPIADGGGANIPSGEVALVNAVTGLPLTADQEFQAGLTCDGKPAAPSPTGAALATCDAAGLGSLFARVPAPGKENDDHNPQRIQPRNLFDAAAGHDNLFHGDRYKWSLRLTVVNLTNKKVLYNFLSTFSGTHYVTPRSISAEIAYHF